MLKRFFIALCASAVLAGGAAAAGETILSVTHDGKQTDYTLEQLREMPVSSFQTTTIWTEGVQTFEGVRLKDLLDSLDVGAGQISAIAINDYAVDIPVSDAVDEGPVLAYHQNAAPMSRRTKGPLWIVYPYDANPEYQSESIYSRSIWQLDRLIIE